MADRGGTSPDDALDPAQAERDITAFIDKANELEGPPVSEIAGHVADRMFETWQAIERQISAAPNNKRIAVMLFLSREARESPADEARHWYLHAASTMMSGLIGAPGAQ